MVINPLRELKALGQSVWLDYIRRDLISGGELHRMIQDDGLQGITSNPSIFEKAILNTNEYEKDIQELISKGMTHKSIYESIILQDIKNAADVFMPVYEETEGKDGYVSLEVDPRLAFSIKDTVDEARRLWAALNRPNAFIKVPATDEGLSAIKQLISEGINVNVTLLFGLTRYQQIINAYMAGIEERLAKSLPVDKVMSVASFFVSRVDTMIDSQLENFIKHGGKKSQLAKKLKGQVAIANAKLVYKVFKGNFFTDEFQNLIDKGANVQRLLWASTSTKNPEYNDIMYVESLVAPNTINTMPVETYNAYKDHGKPKIRIEEDFETARRVLEELQEIGISYDKTVQQLEQEGIRKFIESFGKLMGALTSKVPLH
jgi:transaldolase